MGLIFNVECDADGDEGERKSPRGGGRGERAYFVACLSRLTIDHASLSRRSGGGGGVGGEGVIWGSVGR